MGVEILKVSQDFQGEVLGHGLALETRTHNSEYSGICLKKHFLYNFDTNERTEILPGVRKYDILIVEDSLFEREYLLFATILPLEEDQVQIQMIRYDYVTDESENIYSFSDERINYPTEKRIRIFPLTNQYIMIQVEKKKSFDASEIEGFFEFSQFLFNMSELREMEITDSNLNKNGICNILPVSPGFSVLKTGYSLVEYMKTGKVREADACVESISIINVQQFISDLLLQNNELSLNTISQAHYETVFSPIFVKENYLVYSIVNISKHEEDIYFYNLNTKETVSGKNVNVSLDNGFAKSCVIDNVPYVRLDTERGTEYYNMLRGKVDIIFEKNQYVNEYLNNMFIVSREENRTFRKTKQVVSIYKYPGLNVIHEEKGYFSGAVAIDNEKLYVFIKDRRENDE